MNWLSLGVIGGCVMMFVIALIWHQYKKRMKADEEARANAQKIIDEIAEKEKKKQLKKVATKQKETK
ncbi:MAG: hypothetical protein ACK5MU_00980 [Candidatus Saccharimonadales bacterium]